MALRVTGVGHTYSPDTSFSQEALTDLTVSVERGELLLVLGATGSGKSTLLRLMAGLLEPTSGALTIDDRRLDRDSARGAVGLVFQDAEAQLFADSVIQDVEFGPVNLGEDPVAALASAQRALTDVGLDPSEFGDRSPFALSGGEARRVAIAGVIAMHPRYVLLDEPTAGLDAPGRASVRDLIGRLTRTAGVVVVSHASEEFLGLADKILLLSDGRVSWAGSAADIIRTPERFDEAGLRAPDILRVQQLARAHGIFSSELTLDIGRVAETLVAARVDQR